MYKKRLLTVSLLATVLLLIGCSEYDNGFKSSDIRFRSEFSQKFGNIDPEQDWNYATRAQVTVVTASSRNISIYSEKNGSYTQVASYRNVSGTQVLKFDVEEDTYNIVVNDGTTAYRCIIGGIVDFDAATSAMGGQDSDTRTHNVNRNEWPSQYIIPANITDEERENVVKEFSKVHFGAYNEVILTWDKLFVQQVHKGEIHYIDQAGNEQILGSNQMNHLQIYNKNSSQTQKVYGNNEDAVGPYEHVNDFNSGDQHADYGDIIGDTYMYDIDPTDVVTETIKGVDGQTINWVKQWLYHNSTDSKYHAEYIYKVVDGNLYLGFDFYATLPDGQNANKNMRVERDWVFNDWIIKVIAGQGAIVPQEVLKDASSSAYILAGEDLGSTLDIDYNDVVVKVEHLAGQQVANVIPLAAGGTLASYLFFKDVDGNQTCVGEIHQMLGAPETESGKYKPINLDNANTVVGEAVPVNVGKTWSLACYSTDTWDQSGQTGDNMGGFTIKVLPAGTKAMSNSLSYNDPAFNDAISVVQAPDAGEAPFILCIPYSYTRVNTPSIGKKTIYSWVWPQEFVGITRVYNKFNEWVQDHTAGKDWYTEPNRTLTVNAEGSGGNVVEEEDEMTEEEVAACNTGATANPMAIRIPTYKVEPVPDPVLKLKDGLTTINVENGQVFNIYDYIDTNFPVWCKSADEGSVGCYNKSETMLQAKNDDKEVKVAITQYGFGGKSMEITVLVGRSSVNDGKQHTNLWFENGSQNITVGGSTTATIKTNSDGSTFSVSSDDSSIATATIEGDKLIITGVGEGSTNVWVTVTATDTYQEQKSNFYVTVSKPADNNNANNGLYYKLQYIQGSNWSSESGPYTGNSSISLSSGDYLWIYSKDQWSNEYPRDGLTATYNGQSYTIGTNQYNWPNAIGFYVTGSGTQTVTLHAPASTEFAEQTVTITLNVN